MRGAGISRSRAPAIADLAELGVARISWAGSLYRGAMEWLAGKVASLAEEASQAGLPCARSAELNDLAEYGAARTSLWGLNP